MSPLDAPDGYERTAEMVSELVLRLKARGHVALFAFPPRSIGLIASVADVGHKLARGPVAAALVEQLLAETKRRGLADFPTAMMLRVVLEFHGFVVLEETLEQLDLGPVIGISRGGGRA